MTTQLTYDAFLAWHADATTRCTDGETIAVPSRKFFEHWRRNRLDAMIAALCGDPLADKASPDPRELAILVDLRASLLDEQRKTPAQRRSFEEIERGLRAIYAGDSPYLAGPVKVEVLG